ncbi:hypothetical protein M2390_000823 [Mycetocola sp. BIGb0189]|uniref:hypothetical protein n=1 Tax=Mycetocola sp. BIGb0189 TaxID=2940604 RepID=UPI00216A5E88|nr:hypothetical protein [Mycetocola sp. BIGb0189]MCS4275662.1 hypothetical protein [Mycetocola sp. BIGb0189]
MKTATRTIVTTLAGLGLIAGLAACTADAPKKDDAKASSSASASASPDGKTDATKDEGKKEEAKDITDPAQLDKFQTKCENGTAKVTDGNGDVTVPDCENVIIETSNSIIHLGATTNLTVNGAINDIQGTTVQSATFAGSANTLTTDNTPKIDDKGEQNEAKTR